MCYMTSFRDVKLTNDNIYELKLRVNNQFYHEEFTNISKLMDFCKEKELKAIMGVENKSDKKWSDD